MREIRLNGYIDSEVWFGDEITPDLLRDMLYGEKGDLMDDVHITLNSYGGSCNAATQMHDTICNYPGRVELTVSGTAASAATVVAMAADELRMTAGSLFMIHDPSCFAMGNERDMLDTIRTLQAYKEAIINVYQVRCKEGREEISRLMIEETWMDSKEALTRGFIDRIEEKGSDKSGAENRVTNRANAEGLVRAWYERQRARPEAKKNADGKEHQPVGNTDGKSASTEQESKVNARELRLRLMKFKTEE